MVEKTASSVGHAQKTTRSVITIEPRRESPQSTTQNSVTPSQPKPQPNGLRCIRNLVSRILILELKNHRSRKPGGKRLALPAAAQDQTRVLLKNRRSNPVKALPSHLQTTPSPRSKRTEQKEVECSDSSP